MANLETLEMKISANAQSASQGIGQLVGSLHSLSQGVGKATGGLMRLNAELEKLTQYKGLRLRGLEGIANNKEAKGIEKVTKAFKARAVVMKEFRKSTKNWKSWQYGPRLPVNSINNVEPQRTDEELRQRNPQWYQDPVKQAIEAQKALRDGTGTSEWYEDFKKNTAQVERFAEVWGQIPDKVKRKMTKDDKFNLMKEIKKEVAEAGEAMQDATKPAQTFSKAIEKITGGKSSSSNAKPSVMKGFEYFAHNKKEWNSSMYGPKQLEKQATAFEKFKAAVGKVKDIMSPLKNAGGALARFGNQVGRIAKTMLIRQALRAVISGAKEGLQNFYEYSKRIGNGYASVLDQMASTAGTAKNQLGAALGTALAAVIPILNAIASAAISALNALSQLFALLTGRGTWTKATAGAESFGKAVGGGGSALKEMLADFDELNVIASQGGGGGGGGGAFDYANMFEEMAEFDSRIKGLVEWLENHIPIVNAAVAGLAAALLGLGGAGITISIGLALSFSAGYDIGKNGLNTTNLLEAIGGVVATAIGGAWLGAKVGIGAAAGGWIGLTLGILVTLAGVYFGSVDALYGDVHKSMEEIREDIKDYFKIDDIEIQVINARLANIREAEESVKKALEQMHINFNLDLSGTNSRANIEKLYTSVQDVISTVSNLIEERKTQIKVGLEFTTQFEDPKKVIDFSTQQWTELDGYVKGLGEQIGKILSDGVVSGVDEQQMLDDLKTKLSDVTQAILTGERQGSFAAGISLQGSDFRNQLANNQFDKSTFANYFVGYKEEYASLKKLAEADARATKQSLKALHEGMVAAGTATADEIAQALANYEGYNVAEETALKMKEWAVDGAGLFVQDMQGGLGLILGQSFAKNTFDSIFGSFKELIKGGAVKNDFENVAMLMKEGLFMALSTATGIDKKTLIEISDLLEISGWDLLTTELKTSYWNTLQASLGSTNAMIMMNRTFGVTAKDIVDISGWQKYTFEQKTHFLNSLKEAFGNEEALAAAKEAGMTIIGEIDTGINSNKDIGKVAGQTAAKNIQSQIDATKYDVSVRVHTYISADVKVGTGGGGGIDRVQSIMSNANGAYGIPRGDVFIANEAGAELVGSINGKTSVANQGQIIEGIAGGVQRANSEQNTLLREQNSLLRRILEKETNINLGASAGFGRTVRRSLDMYENLVGG